MKKILSLILCLSICLSGYCSTTFVYNGGKNSRTLRMNVNSTYLVGLTETANGKLEVKAPPFLCLHLPNGLYIGELRTGGNIEQAISPMKVVRSTRPFVSIGSLSFNPKLSGAYLTTGRITYAVFTPLINASSDLGGAFNVELDNSFVTLVHRSANDYSFKKYKSDYQVDWKEEYPGNQKTYLMLGCRAKGVKWNSSAFFTSIYDTYTGLRMYEGFDLSYGGHGWKRRIGNEKSYYYVQLSFKGLKVTFEHNADPDPIYGGTSKKESVEFGVEYNYGIFDISAKHSFENQESTGHKESSAYSLKVGDFFYKGNYVRMESGINLIRGTILTVSKFKVAVKDNYSSVSISGDKVGLTLGYKKRLQRTIFKASINQDRVVTLSLTMN